MEFEITKKQKKRAKKRRIKNEKNGFCSEHFRVFLF